MVMFLAASGSAENLTGGAMDICIVQSVVKG